MSTNSRIYRTTEQRRPISGTVSRPGAQVMLDALERAGVLADSPVNGRSRGMIRTTAISDYPSDAPPRIAGAARRVVSTSRFLTSFEGP